MSSALNALLFDDFQIAAIVSSYVSGLLLHYFAWPIVFYFWSLVAIVWFIAFVTIQRLGRNLSFDLIQIYL